MNAAQKYQKIWNRYYQGCPLFEEWKRELGQEQNINLLVNGDTRSGKSTLGLSIGEAMDAAFQEEDKVEVIRERFVYSAKEFMRTLSREPPNGSVIAWEEVGVGLKSKRWYEEINQIMTDVMQIYGHHSYMIVLTTPQKRFLDRDARVLCNHYIETTRFGLNRHNKTNTCRVQRIFNSSRFDKSYFKNYVFNNMKVGRWVFHAPFTPGLREAYEEHSRGRKILLEKLNEQKVLYHEQKQKAAYLTPEYMATEILENKSRYLRRWGKRQVLNMAEVSAAFGVGTQTETVKHAKNLVYSRMKQEKNGGSKR